MYCESDKVHSFHWEKKTNVFGSSPIGSEKDFFSEVKLIFIKIAGLFFC